MRRALVAALALCAGGCAGVGSASPAEPAVARANRTHEYPSPAPRQPGAFPGFAGPALAVRAFAIGYINWTAATVTGRMRGLATLSVGQARAEVLQAAEATAHDYELRRGGVANSGTVEAVAPLAGGAGRFAVVTRERTTATGSGAYRGLAPSWHVAIATVQRAGAGWVVSGWQPEN